MVRRGRNTLPNGYKQSIAEIQWERDGYIEANELQLADKKAELSVSTFFKKIRGAEIIPFDIYIENMEFIRLIADKASYALHEFEIRNKNKIRVILENRRLDNIRVVFAKKLNANCVDNIAEFLFNPLVCDF